MHLSFRALALGVLLVVCLTARARAQPVVLELSACPVPAPEEVRSLVSLELKERLVPASQPDQPGAQHVQLSCSDIQAELVLRETGARRSLSLSSVPEGLRARLLALSIAELTREQLEPPPPQPVATKSVPREAARPIAPPVPTRVPRYLLSLGVELQAVPMFSVGGAVSLLWRTRRWLALSSSLSVSRGQTAIDSGTMYVTSGSLRVGPALTLQYKRTLLLLGLGARGGMQHLAGEPERDSQARGSQFDYWFLAPALFTGLIVQLGAQAFAELSLELDHSLRRVHAQVSGGETTSLSPLRATGQLALGVAW